MSQINPFADLEAAAERWAIEHPDLVRYPVPFAEDIVEAAKNLIDYDDGKPCPDCGKDWGHGYCGTCKGLGVI